MLLPKGPGFGYRYLQIASDCKQVSNGFRQAGGGVDRQMTQALRYTVYRWDKTEPEAGFRTEAKARQHRRLAPSPAALRIRDERTQTWLPTAATTTTAPSNHRRREEARVSSVA